MTKEDLATLGMVLALSWPVLLLGAILAIGVGLVLSLGFGWSVLWSALASVAIGCVVALALVMFG